MAKPLDIYINSEFFETIDVSQTPAMEYLINLSKTKKVSTWVLTDAALYVEVLYPSLCDDSFPY